MKQGKASYTQSEYKTEPVSKAVLPAGVAALGQMHGNHAMDGGNLPYAPIPMYEGRGLKAPMAGTTTHPHGSQGKR